MSINFTKHLSPEAQARVESNRRNFEKDVAEFNAMDDAALCERVEYFMKNCEFPHRFQPGEPVYDGVIAHVVIPELLRRIRASRTSLPLLPAQFATHQMVRLSWRECATRPGSSFRCSLETTSPG